MVSYGFPMVFLWFSQEIWLNPKPGRRAAESKSKESNFSRGAATVGPVLDLLLAAGWTMRCGFPQNLPSGYVKIAIEYDSIWPFIVDFPMKNGDFP